MEIRYAWRGYLTNNAVNALHAEGFGHEPFDDDWETQLERHSLGWVCADDGDELVGFVNVAWDGAVHAFILDTLVAAHLQRRGIGAQLVAVAATNAREAGCEWLHVDYEPALRGFYVDACGFPETEAGLIRLS
jgi:GNAT superfamily N-acetyltransferase